MDRRIVLNAMKCINTEGGGVCKKFNCPYFDRILENNPERIKFEETYGKVKSEEFWDQCDIDQINEDAIEIMEELIKNEERYKWHDLTQNKKDLPKHHIDILVATNGGKKRRYNRSCYDPEFGFKKHTSNEAGYYASGSVVGWRYIQEFEK